MYTDITIVTLLLTRMSVGNDGFTDCNFVCNPHNGMAWSCNEYCPDYVFSSTTPMTLTRTKSVHNFDTNESDYLLSNVVVVLCVSTLLFTFLLLAYCLSRRRLGTCFNSCRVKESQHTQHSQATPTDDEAGPGRNVSGTNESASLLYQNESGSIHGDMTNSDHGSASEKFVNRLNFVDLNSSSGSSRCPSNVQPPTRAVRPSVHQLGDFTDNADHFSRHETELKEVGERAGLAIGQNSSFAKSITVITATSKGDRRCGNYACRDTDPDFEIDTDRNSSTVYTNSTEAEADRNDFENYAVHDEDEFHNEPPNYHADDNDDDIEEKCGSGMIEGNNLMSDDGKTSLLTNKSENIFSNNKGDIVRVTSDINIREV